MYRQFICKINGNGVLGKVRPIEWEYYIGVGFHLNKIESHYWTQIKIYDHLLSGDSTITEECMNKTLLF